jgi:hypothetical protein
MVHYVKLKQQDLNVIIDTLQAISDYKYQALSSLSWSRFEERYLPQMVEYISKNEFKHVRSNDNVFIWFLDQLCHSRRLVPGVKPSEGIPLIDSELGQRAAEICRAAAKGQVSYDQYSSRNNYDSLFHD